MHAAEQTKGSCITLGARAPAKLGRAQWPKCLDQHGYGSIRELGVPDMAGSELHREAQVARQLVGLPGPGPACCQLAGKKMKKLVPVTAAAQVVWPTSPTV